MENNNNRNKQHSKERVAKTERRKEEVIKEVIYENLPELKGMSCQTKRSTECLTQGMKAPSPTTVNFQSTWDKEKILKTFR